MTIMKVSNPEDLEKWKKAIERLERVIPMTEQDATSTKKFYSNELETAQFWKGCAFEGADDKKLHEIAETLRWLRAVLRPIRGLWRTLRWRSDQ